MREIILDICQYLHTVNFIIKIVKTNGQSTQRKIPKTKGAYVSTAEGRRGHATQHLPNILIEIQMIFMGVPDML